MRVLTAEFECHVCVAEGGEAMAGWLTCEVFNALVEGGLEKAKQQACWQQQQGVQQQ